MKDQVDRRTRSSAARYTHVVWDFNGTILDDIHLGICSVNRMLTDRGLPVIPDAAYYREIFRFPIIEYYRTLGFDFEKEDYYRVLAPEWVSYYLAGEKDCTTMPGVRETMEQIRHLGVSQVLISATEIHQLTSQVERLGLTDMFDEIQGIDNIHAGGKTDIVKAWAQMHPEAIPLFVGDTTHDAEVADAVGADCALFIGGHQSERRLQCLGKPLIRAIPQVCDLLMA